MESKSGRSEPEQGRTPGAPATAVFRGSDLEVFDQYRKLLWREQFSQADAQARTLLLIRDVDDDGRLDIRPGRGPGPDKGLGLGPFSS